MISHQLSRLSPPMILIISLIFLLPLVTNGCDVKIPSLSLTPMQYNGSWFVVARKAPNSRSFLPDNVTSSLVRLQIEGNILNMTEYHTKDDVCMPPLNGVWKPKDEEPGYHMDIRSENGQLFSMSLSAIYHEYSGEQNEEMNMVVYGCGKPNPKGGCIRGEEMLMIMSNSRHPQTLQLFKSAKLIEDAACIDILELKILQTYTACGDDIVDEDQKLIHATIDENNEFVDVECKVANFRPAPNNMSTFFDEPRVLTVVAYIDPVLSSEQIAHISCIYDTKDHATCEWIRQHTCLKSELHQTLTTRELIMSTNYTTINGTITTMDWSGSVIWENGDEFISMKCLLIDEDGGCDSFRIYVWSDEDHMDQPTINEIYRQLQTVCVDPTDLVFLNTFHECLAAEPPPPEEQRCGPQQGWTPLNSAMLQGVWWAETLSLWYFAADLNADPKIFLQSAVISLTPNDTDPNLLHLRYFAQKEADSECVGPGEGTVRLHNDSSLEVVVEYTYTLVPKFRNTMSFKYQVLYADNQRAVLYWCFRRHANGTCIQHDVNFMIRSRHFSRNDLTMILPYLEKVCIDKDSLRWFDLHSLCGTEMSASTKLRRDLVTLSHYDVLYILTHVQEPRCIYHEIRGVKVDLQALEKAGVWFLTSRYDEMAMDTYAMVGRVSALSTGTAVLRLFQSAALPGEPLDCYTRVFTVKEASNGSDYFYELHYESTTKNSTTMIFRFLFFNRHVGVLYSCLAHSAEGKCEEKAIYVISRHESIDHAELIVLETIAKTVCVEPNVLYHTAVHDDCVFAHSQLKPVACSSVEEAAATAEWETLNASQISTSYSQLTYHAVASSRLYSNPFAIRWDGSSFQKITDEQSGCLSSPVTVEFSARNHFLARIGQEVVLLHPAATHSDVLLKEAQLSGQLPCLHPVELANTTCQQLQPPVCKSPGPLQVAEQLYGNWVLYSSDPTYVLNQRCTISAGGGDYHRFVCHTESWIGECERETMLDLRVDAWGGFTISPAEEHVPLRIPSELFARGNISVTADRIVMMNDGDLVGRRYSIWLREGATFTQAIATEVTEYCIWPLAPQIRSMEKAC